MNNQMMLLTPPGESAIQVFCLSNPDQNIRNLVLKHFEPKNPRSSSLKLGVFKDGEGEILDEIFLEEHKDKLLFHLHGGAMSLFRLKSELLGWGCVEVEPTCPDDLEGECLWAIQHAPGKEATAWALKNLEVLPQAETSEGLLSSLSFGKSVFEPIKYYLVGETNVGKSSLINRLIGRERVVVDDTAGTTRDLIEITFFVAERNVLLVDAAGLRETSDNIERSGQDSLKKALFEGRVLWVVNPHEAIPACPVDDPVALVLTHQDLGVGELIDFDGPILRTGAKDDGEEIKKFIEEDLPQKVAPPFIFTERQLDFFSNQKIN